MDTEGHPINWGQPDRLLARGVCESVSACMSGQAWNPPVGRKTNIAMNVCGWCLFIAVAGIIVAIMAHGGGK